MYLNILKKDLKRKKTMNIILLLFVILSAMFLASSVNNVIAVTNGLDYFFDKAGISDYAIISPERNGESSLAEILEDSEVVDSYESEQVIFASSDNFTQNGNTLADFSSIAVLMSVDNAKLNYFDSDNNIISEVNPGEVYISGSFAKEAGLEPGDRFDISHGGVTMSLKFAGIAKDVFLGADFMSVPRFILNESDYQKFTSDKTLSEGYMGSIYYIYTENIPALQEAVADDGSIVFDGDREMLKTCYMINMLVAGLLMIVSVCLIFVAFVVLRFTIGFTLSEEFREIGVMKAIGIKNSSIRMLYIVKYLGISMIGAAIGFVFSIPLSDYMLKSVSENMVLGNDNSVLVGVLCCLAVVVIILLFCYSCTRRIKKFSPVDAVRSGQTGERFRKKERIHLGRNKLPATAFLSLNDVLSSPKQYGIITAVFTICMLLVLILANSANTLNSEKLLFLFGTTKSDVYYTDSSSVTHSIMGNGSEILQNDLNEVEETLAENDMPGKCHVEILYKYPITFNGKNYNVTFQQCRDTKADQYVYSEGTAPQYANEIAVTKQISEKLGAHIGDTVKISIGGVEDDYIITAYFQSMTQIGNVVRLHEDVETDMSASAGSYPFQIDFDDDPDPEEIDKRVDKLKDIFKTDNVFNAADFVKDCTGASDIISGVKNLVLIVTMIIIVLIIVLMERSFIAKEKAEIALLKALGFKNSHIIAQHTLRFAIVGILSSLIAVALCMPLTKLAIDPIFGIMGAVSGVEYEINYFEVFAFYPLIILAVTVLSTFLTSLYVGTVKASDTADIE